MSSPSGYTILSMQRVGSHLLGGVIGSHSDFSHSGEVLIPETRKPGSFDAFIGAGNDSLEPASAWREYLAHLQMRKPGARYAGFLTKYEHVSRIGGRDLISDPVFGDLRIVHLIRRNMLRTIASHHLAVARRVHVISEPMQHEVNSVTIPSDDLVDILRKKTSIMNGIRERLSDRPYAMEVAYEDVVDDGLISEEIVSRLCRFFDVPDEFARKPKTIKLASPDLSCLIVNYDEVVAALRGTEFEEMLD